jgi:hypothetical protein
VIDELEDLNLEPRALGRSDYPTGLPLREVIAIARRCAGGVILGFEQFLATAGVARRGTERESKLGKSPRAFPSPWNHLEAGILATMGLPLLVFREDGIDGGIFDPGVTDVFIHPMPKRPMKEDVEDALHDVFLKWQGVVRARYYDDAHRVVP